MRVRCSLIAEERRMPKMLHDRRAGEHLTGRLGKQQHEVELSRREPDLPSVDLDGATQRVDVEPSHREARGRAISSVDPPPTQERRHSADELGHRKRLSHVVISPGLEPDHHIKLAVARGQQDDRKRTARSDLSADVEAARPWHHHVENCEIVPSFARSLEGRGPVDHGVDLVTLALQRVGERTDQGKLVVSHEYAGAHQVPTSTRAVTLTCGSRISTVVPAPGRDWIEIVPSIASTYSRQIPSPNPNPPA